MKQQELVEKWQFFQRVLKMGNFGQTAKGGPFDRNWPFFSSLTIPKKLGPKKWPISRILQTVPPLQFGQNCPFFLAQLR